MTYEFRKADGTVCCRSNNIKLLCDHCVQKALVAARGAMTTTTAPTVAAAAPSDVPAPPSLAAAITSRRGQSAPSVTEPHFLSIGPRPRPTVARSAETIDDPPSLVDALRNGRVR